MVVKNIFIIIKYTATFIKHEVLINMNKILDCFKYHFMYHLLDDSVGLTMAVFRKATTLLQMTSK